MFLLRVVLSAALATLSLAAIAGNRPTGYVTICNEGKTCSVASNTTVAFGRADQFFYKVLSGSFACSEQTFGGRIGGGVNECSVPRAGQGSSSSSTSSSSSSSSSGGVRLEFSRSAPSPGGGSEYEKCATFGGTCQFTGTRDVFMSYRVRVYEGPYNFTDLTIWDKQTMAAPVRCDFATFPRTSYNTDPRAATVAECYLFNRPRPVVTGASCVSTGEVVVDRPIVVTGDAVFDGGCKTFVPNAAMENDGSMAEEVRSFVFQLHGGATLKNVIIGGLGARGVSVVTGPMVTTTLDNVTWQRQGGYAVRVSGTPGGVMPYVQVKNGTTNIGSDPNAFFSTIPVFFDVSNFIYRGRGTDTVFSHMRSIGISTRAHCKACDIQGARYVFRTDSAESFADLRESSLNAEADVCTGYAPYNCTTFNNDLNR